MTGPSRRDTGGTSTRPVRTDPSALRLDAVTRRFGGHTAVDGVSLDLPAGGRLGVIGPNGAGKTTLFRLIAGELRPTSGNLFLFGERVTRRGARTRARAGVARTFQVSNLFPSLTVEQNVRIAARARTTAAQHIWPTRPEGRLGERISTALQQIRLSGRQSDLASSLSHGERRQLEIAMALVTQPRLILFDEPAAGLSAAERRTLRDVLEDLPETIGFLLIEHDMALAMELVDRVLCLDAGRSVAHGTPAEIRANPTVRAAYLGGTR